MLQRWAWINWKEVVETTTIFAKIITGTKGTDY